MKKFTLRYKFLATDQYGDIVWIKDHPRQELMDHHGVKHADKMYIDGPDGKPMHIGYIVQKHWYDVMKLSPLND